MSDEGALTDSRFHKRTFDRDLLLTKIGLTHPIVANASVTEEVGPENTFKEVNARNKMEGGAKGIVIHGNQLAVCSPEHGIEIYSYQEKTAEQSI